MREKRVDSYGGSNMDPNLVRIWYWSGLDLKTGLDPFWLGSVFQLGSETTPSRISTIELEVGVEEESHARLSASSDWTHASPARGPHKARLWSCEGMKLLYGWFDYFEDLVVDYKLMDSSRQILHGKLMNNPNRSSTNWRRQKKNLNSHGCLEFELVFKHKLMGSEVATIKILTKERKLGDEQGEKVAWC